MSDQTTHYSLSSASDGQRVLDEWRTFIAEYRDKPDDEVNAAFLARFNRPIDIIVFELSALKFLADHVLALAGHIRATYQDLHGIEIARFEGS